LTIVTELKTSALHTGYVLTSASRSKASDYIAVVKALLLCAMYKYEAFIAMKDAFPTTTLQVQWAEMCWKNTAAATKEYYKLTDHMASLVSHSLRLLLVSLCASSLFLFNDVVPVYKATFSVLCTHRSSSHIRACS